jgi:hypothetical protein
VRLRWNGCPPPAAAHRAAEQFAEKLDSAASGAEALTEKTDSIAAPETLRPLKASFRANGKSRNSFTKLRPRLEATPFQKPVRIKAKNLSFQQTPATGLNETDLLASRRSSLLLLLFLFLSLFQLALKVFRDHCE